MHRDESIGFLDVALYQKMRFLSVMTFITSQGRILQHLVLLWDVCIEVLVTVEEG